MVNKNNKLLLHEQFYFKEITYKILFIFFVTLVISIFLVSIEMFYEVLSFDKIIVKSDYPHLYTSALLISKGMGEKIYDFDTQSEYQKEFLKPLERNIRIPARNPAFTYLLYIPFAVFSFFISYKIFLITNIFLCLVFVFIASRIFPKIRGFSKIFAYFLIFAFYPISLAMTKGQPSVFLALIYLFFYHFLNKKPFLAGLIYAVLLVKPQFFLVGLPFFLIISQEKMRFVKGLMVASLTFLLISIYLSGVGNLLAYPSFIAATENHFFGSPTYAMFSIHNSLSSFLAFFNVNNFLLYGVEILLYGLTLIIFWKNKSFFTYNQLFIFATFFLVIFSIHVLPYDLTLLTIPLFSIYNSIFGKSRSFLSLIFACYILILPTLLVFVYQWNPFIIFFSCLLAMSKSNKLQPIPNSRFLT